MEMKKHTTQTMRSIQSRSIPGRQLYLYILIALALLMNSIALSAESRNRPKSRSSVQNTKINAAQQNDLMLTQMPINSTSRSVWRSNITLRDNREAKSRKELQALIARINAFHFQGQEPPSESATPMPSVFTSPTLPTPTTPPEVNLTPELVKSEDKEPSIAPIESKEILEQTRQTFHSIVEHPESLPDPLALAELLFRAHYMEEAAMCYEEALKRAGRQQTGNTVDISWILFQIGNCLRETDPRAALNAYQQVTTTYPDSPWTPIARVKSRWIDWMIKDDPRGLLKEVQ
jgi:TolA-binding protein